MLDSWSELIWALVVAAALAGALFGYRLWRIRRARLSSVAALRKRTARRDEAGVPRAGLPSGATRYPILLAHGYFGFDKIGLAQLHREYFCGVPQVLRGRGHTVHMARVSPAAGIHWRAAQLAKQIEAIDAPRVNIIAHSMGGLDARYVISRLGLADRVASLTTIGTPHHGTPLADLLHGFGDWNRLRRLLAMMGANVDGVFDVCTSRMQSFNLSVPDSPLVAYRSVVGVADPTRALNGLLAFGHDYLLLKAGRNDGIVPAASQRWGEALGEIEADHWAQIGWFGCFDVEGFYAGLAEKLAERNL